MKLSLVILLLAVCHFYGNADATITAAATTKVVPTTKPTTAAPKVTTAAPKVTTPVPKVTTAAPKVTTPTPKQTPTTVKTTTVPTTTVKAALAAEGVTAVPRQQCVFPFWYNKGWQHTCVKYDNFGDYWCSLTSNFTADEDWRRCGTHDLKRYQCHIPFKYNNQTHSKCLPIKNRGERGANSHNTFWCAVTPEISKFSFNSPDWAYCEDETATGTAYLKVVGSNRFPPPGTETGTMSAVKNPHAKADEQTGSTAGAVGAQAAVGIAVGTICALLAVVAVVSGIVIRKKQRQNRGQKLLPQEDIYEKGHYGGTD